MVESGFPLGYLGTDLQMDGFFIDQSGSKCISLGLLSKYSSIATSVAHSNTVQYQHTHTHTLTHSLPLSQDAHTDVHAYTQTYTPHHTHTHAHMSANPPPPSPSSPPTNTHSGSQVVQHFGSTCPSIADACTDRHDCDTKTDCSPL